MVFQVSILVVLIGSWPVQVDKVRSLQIYLYHSPPLPANPASNRATEQQRDIIMTVDTTLNNQRLRVTIVGAGLCGLATGASMREYADVTVSRQSGSHFVSLCSTSEMIDATH